MNPIVVLAVELLRQYLQINTSNPKPDYERAISFIEQRALQDGFQSNRISLPSGKQVLVIEQRGTDPSLPALALNHHIDVVPATPDGWKHPPFDGVVDNDVIYGRGTQDMKGVGIVHYASLLELKKKYAQPRRTIYLFCVPEEEVGGFKGTAEFVQSESFKALNVGYVLDEGLPSGNEQQLLIKVAERKAMQILITGKGSMAHGSLLHAHNVNHDLIKFLNHIVQFQSDQQKKQLDPGLLLSMNITVLKSGLINDQRIIYNVIPEQAQAALDIRVPPGMTNTQARKLFDELMKPFPMFSYDIHGQSDDYEQSLEYRGAFYNTLEQCIQDAGLEAKPFYFQAASDLRFYKALGIEGFGFTPFTTKDNLHGVNESIRVSDVGLGINVMTKFLERFCL